MSSILKIEFEKLRKTKSFWAIMLFLVFITSTVAITRSLEVGGSVGGINPAEPRAENGYFFEDNSANALDSKGVEMVKCILQQEKERGALIVLTCHDYSVLKELSDSIYFIEEGRVVGYERQ